MEDNSDLFQYWQKKENIQWLDIGPETAAKNSNRRAYADSYVMICS